MTAALPWFCTECRVTLEQLPVRIRCPQCGLVVVQKGGYWDVGMPVDPGFPAARPQALANMEVGHFWFAPRDLLVRKICERLAVSAVSVVELGCGTGRFLAGFRDAAHLALGVEAYESSIQAAAARGVNAVWLRGDAGSVPVAAGCFDLALAMDVLEHADPARLLGEAHRLVRSGGWLLVSVPASPRLWSEADERAGHRCRYTPRMLSSELKAHGWEPCGQTHYQFFLFPLLLFTRMLMKGRLRSETAPPEWLNRVCRLINMFEVRLFPAVRLPWGSSIIAWARKT